MTIARSPHPIFAAIWLVWYGFVLTALLRPGSPVLGLIVLLAFLPIEGAAVALNTGMRDTLSEIETWVIRHLAKTESTSVRGWNAVLLTQILMITALFGRTVAHYSGMLPLGVVTGALMTVFLYDHWTAPQRFG